MQKYNKIPAKKNKIGIFSGLNGNDVDFIDIREPNSRFLLYSPYPN